VLTTASTAPLVLPKTVSRGLAVTPLAPLATGLAAVDAALGGGVPRGAVTEVVGGASSGRTTLAYALVTSITVAGELAVWVDVPDAFDPKHAEDAGVDLTRVLWVRPPDSHAGLHAVTDVLQAGTFPFVLLDLAGVRLTSALQATAHWLRIRCAAIRSRSAVVVVGSECVAGTFASLRLETMRRRVVMHSGPGASFDGFGIAVAVRKSKVGPPSGRDVTLDIASGW
jgi:hypothetical protein